MRTALVNPKIKTVSAGCFPSPVFLQNAFSVRLICEVFRNFRKIFIKEFLGT